MINRLRRYLLLLPAAALLAGACAPASEGLATAALSDTSAMRHNVGKTITLVGKVSDIPWQHMIDYQPDRRIEYFDTEQGSQTVIYVAPEFDCTSRARVTGTVIELTGGGKGHKSEEIFTEYHLVVNSWDCLD